MSADASFPTKYWHRLQDDRVQCDVCPRLCKLDEGQRGLCLVRKREEGAVVLTTYGRSSGFCIDPIEKKPLNHFLPGTPVLSFGTAGCNLTCRFCQNWSISKSRENDILAAEASPEGIARAAEKNACRSVAFTYNDPVVFLEYAVDTAIACRKLGIKTVAVTAGYIMPRAREEFYRHIDAANVDLKAFTEGFYKRTCSGRLVDIQDTLVYIKRQTAVWLEITNLIIPGLNDSTVEIDRMTRWIARSLGPEVPLHFTAFHPDWKMTDRPHTPPETLLRSREIAKGNGLKHVYTGNIQDEESGGTYCGKCGERIIGRAGYTLSDWKLDAKGRCVKCGEPLPGVFESAPGEWGSRRLPISIRGITRR